MSRKFLNQFACSRLLLPEHREQLQGHHRARNKKEELRPPCLDEQQREELDILVNQSLGQGLEIRVIALGEEGRYSTTGRVIRLDPVRKRITLATPAGVEVIARPKIIGVEAISPPPDPVFLR